MVDDDTQVERENSSTEPVNVKPVRWELNGKSIDAGDELHPGELKAFLDVEKQDGEPVATYENKFTLTKDMFNKTLNVRLKEEEIRAIAGKPVNIVVGIDDGEQGVDNVTVIAKCNDKEYQAVSAGGSNVATATANIEVDDSDFEAGKSYPFTVEIDAPEDYDMAVGELTGNINVVPGSDFKVYFTEAPAGQTLNPGQKVRIAWDIEGDDSQLKNFILYYNDGSSLIPVKLPGFFQGKSLSPDKRDFVWTVPDLDIPKCNLEIIAYDKGGHDLGTDVTASFIVKDTSKGINLRFTQVPVNVKSNPGDVRTITWAVDDDSEIESYILYFSNDAGTNWTPVPNQNIGKNRTFNWTVPNDPTEEGFLMVMAMKGTDTLDEATHDKPFEIAGQEEGKKLQIFSQVLNAVEGKEAAVVVRVGDEADGIDGVNVTLVCGQWSNTQRTQKMKFGSLQKGFVVFYIPDLTVADNPHDYVVNVDPPEGYANPGEHRGQITVQGAKEAKKLVVEAPDNVNIMPGEYAHVFVIVKNNKGQGLNGIYLTLECDGKTHELKTQRDKIGNATSDGVAWFIIPGLKLEGSPHRFTVNVPVQEFDGGYVQADPVTGQITVSRATDISVNIISPKDQERVKGGQSVNIEWEISGLNSIMGFSTPLKIECYLENGHREEISFTSQAHVPRGHTELSGETRWIVPEGKENDLTCNLKFSFPELGDGMQIIRSITIAGDDEPLPPVDEEIERILGLMSKVRKPKASGVFTNKASPGTFLYNLLNRDGLDYYFASVSRLEELESIIDKSASVKEKINSRYSTFVSTLNELKQKRNHCYGLKNRTEFKRQMAAYLKKIIDLMKANRETAQPLRELAERVEKATGTALGKLDARVILSNEVYISFFINQADQIDAILQKTARMNQQVNRDIQGFRFTDIFKGMNFYMAETVRMYELLNKISKTLMIFRRRLKAKPQ